MAISEGYLRHGRGFYHAITCIFDLVVEVGGCSLLPSVQDNCFD